MRKTRLSLLLGMFLLLVQPGLAGPEVPALRARVNDLAGVLQPAEAARMESFLADFEAKTSNQLAVLIIPSLEGQVAEDYTIRVGREWGLGTKERDNGVLLFIAVQDRVIRIEVGLGLQGALTDALSSRIIRNEMAPLLVQGSEQWGEAVWAGLQAITRATAGEYQGSGSAGRGPFAGVNPTYLPVAFFILGIIGRLLRIWISALIGAIAGLVLLGWVGLPIGLIAGLLAPIFLGLRGGAHTFGGGFSGGGFSGGGFSGGGGSFDGGGASGRF